MYTIETLSLVIAAAFLTYLLQLYQKLLFEEFLYL